MSVRCEVVQVFTTWEPEKTVCLQPELFKAEFSSLFPRFGLLFFEDSVLFFEDSVLLRCNCGAEGLIEGRK